MQTAALSRLINFFSCRLRTYFCLAALLLFSLYHAPLPVTASETYPSQDQDQSDQPVDPDQVSAAALEHTQRLSKAMDSPEAVSPDDQVQWIDLGGRPEAKPTPPPADLKYKPIVKHAPPVKPQRNQPPATPPVAAEPPSTPNTTNRQPSDQTASSEDTRQLLENLRRSISGAANPEVFRAVATASLNLVDPDRKFGPDDIAELDPFRREQILRFNQIVASVGRRLSQGKDPFAPPPAVIQQTATPDPIDEQPATFQEDQSQEDHAQQEDQPQIGRAQEYQPQQADQSSADQSIRIRLAQLCTRVRGYGVYDPIESNRFVIGKNQRMIVYVELDHFRSIQTTSKTGGPLHQVKLNQEITLYNSSDGYEVWRYPKVEIVDESRNQRRDFFLVQMVDLPQKLSIGQYILKIRVADVAGACRDEMSVPINLLGDESQALTSGEQ